MLATRVGVFRAVVALAASAIAIPAAHAEFMAEISLSSDLVDPDHVAPGTEFTVMAFCTWSAAATNPGDNITRIQLNWTGSSAEIDLPNAAGWVWHVNTDGINSLGDADLADGKVNRQGAGVVPGATFEIGRLELTAPEADGAYTVNLTGGSLMDGSATVIADGTTYLYQGNNLTLSSFTFTVPEPASLGLLVLGAIGILGRRRRS